MTRLIIARHGNTFNAGETPRRVGARTDIPLTTTGQEQARKLGQHLKEAGLIPSQAFSSQQQRTRQTASLALEAMGLSLDATPLASLNELDYGPDENKTEDDVIARLGAQALKDWDEKAVVPRGWLVDPVAQIASWQELARQLESDHHGETILIVTSNGTARFAPYITGNYDEFCRNFPIKLATGSYGLINNTDGHWQVESWNIKPA
ncbi:MAG: histidine phosphatase family protein [Micavibrio sp.]